MYGIVNKAIEEHVVTEYGGDKWASSAGLDIEVFVSNKPIRTRSVTNWSPLRQMSSGSQPAIF